MSIVYPTGTCFDDALEFCEARARANDPAVRDGTLLLVHAIRRIEGSQVADPARGIPAAGTVTVHAWVELGETVWEFGLLDDRRVALQIPRADYYAQAELLDVTRYTMRQAWANNQAFRTTGPWRREYLALCADRVRAVRP